MSAVLTVGMKVWYVPDSCHWAATNAKGDPQFNFIYVKDQPGRHRQGDAVDVAKAGRLQRSGDKIKTKGGQEVKAVSPRYFWPAWVVAVNADGTADLDVAHSYSWTDPNAVDRQNCFVTLHCPDRKAHPTVPGIRLDPTGKTPHSFHVPGE